MPTTWRDLERQRAHRTCKEAVGGGCPKQPCKTVGGECGKQSGKLEPPTVRDDRLRDEKGTHAPLQSRTGGRMDQ